jgi:hypothetical protein
MKLGEELYFFDRDEQWLDLGHVSFKAYLADPDVNVGVASGYRFVAVYKKYIVELELESLAARLTKIGSDKLDYIKDHVTAKNAEEMLLTARTNSLSVLKDMYRTTKEPQNPKLHYKFAVAYGYMYNALQELLEEKPKLRKFILAVFTALDKLKEKI